MNKEKVNKLILLFLILQPIIDVLVSLQIRSDISIYSIGTIIRGLFFLFILIYLYRSNVARKTIFVFLIYVFLAMGYYLINTENNLSIEIINLVKIFYLPFLIYYFNYVGNSKISDRTILGIYLLYLNLIIVPYLLGFGFNVYKDFENKKGFIGLFYSGNEISAIILGLMPIVTNYIIKSKNYLLKIFVIIETIFVILLVGTKTLLLGFFIVILFFIIRYLKNSKNNKFKIISILIFLALISLVIVLFPKLIVSKNLNVALEFYNVENIQDLVSYDGINDIIFSQRLKYLKNINSVYVKSSNKEMLYGLGNDKILSIKDIEIDLFDLFYSIGLIGFIVYILLIKSSIGNTKLKDYYKLSLFLFIATSFITGHVLLNPAVSIYFAVLYMLNANTNDDRKRILLVSNMYPNEKYKHYGAFIKNIKEILEDNNFKVDLVVKYKSTNFLNKLFGYIIFYIKTTLFGIVNNYDYIYVHYISHSTLGALIPKLTSKNTKLILNAHGNDIVADYDFEIKNVKRSKKFLKYADKVVVPSNYYKSVLIDDYNILEDMIVVYPSGGVNTDKFVKKDKEISKKNCKLNNEYDYIGYIGRIEKDKGYDTFLKAIKELEKENKIGNKRFLIVGTGLEEDKMTDLVKELDISKYLEIRNMVSQDELVDLYNSLDLFIFPTYRKSESLGLVGLEAMSCETFVIASNNYGPTDYLINNKNGLFFEPKNEIDLKDKILQFYDLNNEQYKKIIKKARETAERYNYKNTENILFDIF